MRTKGRPRDIWSRSFFLLQLQPVIFGTGQFTCHLSRSPTDGISTFRLAVSMAGNCLPVGRAFINPVITMFVPMHALIELRTSCVHSLSTTDPEDLPGLPGWAFFLASDI